MSNVTTHLPHITPLPKEQRVFLKQWQFDEIYELQFGMIKSAIEDIRDGRKSKLMQKEAREWLVSDDLSSPFSFSNCCQTCGLDETVLRNMVNKLTQGALYDICK